MPLLDVRDPVTKKLLFRYDPESDVVAIKREHGQLREIHLSVIRDRYLAQQETPLSVPNADKKNAPERREPPSCLEYVDGAPMAG